MFEFEKKWQERWEKERIFQPEPNGKPKKFITAAFPYPNSPQHIGHGRTYTIADVYARFWRMMGYNVLFPMGFHVTGTPIIAMAKRIEEGDEELLDIFERIYGISRKKAKSLTNPKELVLYFSKEIEQGMKEMGYSIDWRRKFYTFDKHFNAFIQWQFKVLKERGCLKRGKQPLAWCPSCNSALSSHDTKHDVDPEVEEMVAILFKLDDCYIPTATYRPETLYGITNLWINPNATYIVVEARIGDEEKKLILTADVFEQLRYQIEMKKVNEIDGKQLIGKKARSPFGDVVPILPASFVNPEEGTGAVMSVPAHAPFDYIALQDLKKANYPLAIEIEPRKIIALDGYDLPARDVIPLYNITSQQDPKLKDATKEVYRKELKEGKMCVEGLDGMPVEKAREKVKEMLLKQGDAFLIYEIANKPVFCRCGAKAVVKIVEDQWFINYSLDWWKDKAISLINEMSIVPKQEKEVFLQVVNWLREKPCTRNRGLGTEFPFAKGQIIEPLSDSTIYPAFYTISHLHSKDAPLTDEELDFIFLGVGKGSERAMKMRNEFLYWYPCDSRHSGADLVWNHLTFYIFNHTAIFEKALWPKQIVVNGFVLMEGQKMSKSLGNILPLRKAIRQYGADTIRMSLVSGAELDGDTDFSDAVAKGVRMRLEFFLDLIEKANKPAQEDIDFYILSKLHRRLATLVEDYQHLRFRKIAKGLFYEMYNELQWYLKRAKQPRLREFFDAFIPALAPIIPHVAEEMWERLGKEPFVSLHSIEVFDTHWLNEELELLEEEVKKLTADIVDIVERTGKKPKEIIIYIPEPWKYEAYNVLRMTKDIGKGMEYAKERSNLQPFLSKLPTFFKHYLKHIHSLPAIPRREKEKDYLNKTREFFEKEFNAEVVVLDEDGTKPSFPGKPGILLR